MLNMFSCKVITPEKIIYDVQATYVSWPTWDGQRGAMTRTSPMVAKLGIGVLSITTSENLKLKVLINGGIGEVGKEGLTILTDGAEIVNDIDLEKAQVTLEQAKSAIMKGTSDRESKEKEYYLALARVAAVS